MRLVNGANRSVKFNKRDIRREASQEGNSSLVVATCDNGTEISISQHGDGSWDISINENPIDQSFDFKEAETAIQEFIRLVQQHNS